MPVQAQGLREMERWLRRCRYNPRVTTDVPATAVDRGFAAGCAERDDAVRGVEVQSFGGSELRP
jgi:hypothetical protein